MSTPLPTMFPRWRRVRLVVARPPGPPAPYQADEVALSLLHALGALGCEVDIAANEAVAGGTNIYLLAHLLAPSAAATMPAGSILYNLEQLFDQSPWLSQPYRDLLARSTVWDYSRRNLAALAGFADPRRLHHVPLGHVPQLARIAPAPVEDIDVLFYGTVNARRRAVLRELESSGVRLRVAHGIGGAERDALIARARLVLNLHFYPTAIFELVRVAYLLANGRAVVAECGPDTEIDADIREAVAGAPYEQLCARALALLGDEAARRALAARGQAIFARRCLPDILARAIAATETARAAPAAIRRGPPLRLAEAPAAPAAAHRRRPLRVLFHAINGVGLGHVMRLSLIAGALGEGAETAIFTSCPVARRFWPGRLFGIDPRLDDRFALEPARRGLLAFHLAVNRFAPDLVVFDTHWPYPMVGHLREHGIPSILVLAPLAPGMMQPALRVAVRDFATILVPAVPAEMESVYRGEPEILDRLAAPPCRLIGPVARAADGAAFPAEPRACDVIFTLGGGGEHFHRNVATGVDTYLDAYRAAALALHERLGLEPLLAAGPLLGRSVDGLWPFRLLQSERLHELFGPETLVVTRGGYNTTWEAVVAGARLVVTGGYTVSEDLAARGRFLEEAGVARYAPPEAPAILAACLGLLGAPPPALDHPLRRAVNGGLAVARATILAAAADRAESAA
jgi:hypothetical protein